MNRFPVDFPSRDEIERMAKTQAKRDVVTFITCVVIIEAVASPCLGGIWQETRRRSSLKILFTLVRRSSNGQSALQFDENSGGDLVRIRVEMCSREVSYIVHEQLSDSKRKSRNLSEKKRRDAFNLLVTELAVLVAGVERRLDKSNVLKQTISFLKQHNQLQTECVSGSEEVDRGRPAFLTSEEYFRLLLDSFGAFLFVVEVGDDGGTATICYVSQDAGAKLGAAAMREKLRGKSLYDFLDKDCETLVKEAFKQRSSDQKMEWSKDILRFSCTVPMRNYASSDVESKIGVAQVELSVVGRFKRLEASSPLLCICVAKCSNFGSNAISLSPLNVQLASPHEFGSKLDVEWRFIEVDPSVTPILGYQPLDMLGTSGYDYCHPDDLDQLMESHQRLKSSTDGTTAPYRFRTKSEKYVWIRTRFYITYHQWTSKPEYVVCINELTNCGSSISGDNESVGIHTPLSDWKSFSSEKEASNGNRSDVYSQNRQIFKPQPGVSIEHVPISASALASRPPPAKRPRDESASILGDESLQSIGQLNEKMLWELLDKRQTNLQEKIFQHQQELRRLQDQLFSAMPLLSSPASSNSTLDLDLTSPASSSLSPAGGSISSVGLSRSNGHDWLQHQYGRALSNTATPNFGVGSDQGQFFNGNTTRDPFM